MLMILKEFYNNLKQANFPRDIPVDTIFFKMGLRKTI